MEYVNGHIQQERQWNLLQTAHIELEAWAQKAPWQQNHPKPFKMQKPPSPSPNNNTKRNWLMENGIIIMVIKIN